MKLKMSRRKNFLALIFLLGFYTAVSQKLPNKQESNIFAPSNVKIDGIPSEWNNQFKAFNNATELFYTVANDDNNLYFVIQAKNPRVIEKLIQVGIKITINKLGKKDDAGPETASLIYPNIDVKTSGKIIMYAGAKAKPSIPLPPRPPGMPVDSNYDKPILKTNDSLRTLANEILARSSNVIQVVGLKDIPDGEMSIYNEQRILVAERFDNTAAYTYELALPLKYLGLDKSHNHFAYNFKIEGRLTNPKHGMRVDYVYIDNRRVDVDQDLDSATDFWADYTLAQK